VSRFEGPHVVTTCATRHKTLNLLFTCTLLKPSGNHSNSSPPYTTCGACCHEHYLTSEHFSQGCIQIRGSPRCHYMRYSSQNPKTALWSTLWDLPMRNIWIVKVIWFFVSYESTSLGPWNNPRHLIPKRATFMGACRCTAKTHIWHPYQPNPNPKLDP
jgi:hypothetical protein